MNTTPNIKIPFLYSLEDIQFSDIFKIEDTQRMQDLFSDATGVASQITYPDGKAITNPSNFCSLYEKIFSVTEKEYANWITSDLETGSSATAEMAIQSSLSEGLRNAHVKINVNSKHLANWYIGQVRNKVIDEKLMLQYADEIGINREEFIEALSEVPVMSVKQFEKVTEMLSAFVHELSEKGFNNLLLKKQVAKREDASELLSESAENFLSTCHSLSDAVIETDKSGLILNINPIAESICGLTKAEVSDKPIHEIFKIIDSKTSEILVDPVKRVIESARSGALSNSMILISGNGTEYPVSDKAAPLMNKDGFISGVVLVFSDFTQQCNAQKQIRESEEKFHSLYLKMREGVAIHKLIFNELGLPYDYTITETNPAFGIQLGIDSNSVIGKTSREAYGTSEPPFFEIYCRVALTGEPKVFESYFPPLKKHFLISAYCPAKNTFATIFEDITIRKNSEETLKESEQKYRNLVSDMQVGLLIQGPQAEILMSNAKALEFLGINEDQLLGKSSFDPDWNVIHEDGSPFPANTHPVPQAIANRKSVRDIVMGVYRPAIGDRIWLLVCAEPQLNNDGTIQQVVCTFIDITKRKQAEEALQKERLLFRTLIDNIPDSIYLKDLDGRKTLANVTEVSYMGAKTEAEVLGKDDFAFYPKEIAEKFFADDQAVLRGQQVINREEYIPGENKNRRWLLTSKLPLRDTDNQIIGLVGIGHDITDRKIAEETIHNERLLLRTLIDNIPDLVYLKDLDGRKKLANLTEVNFIGAHSEAEVLDKDDFAFFPKGLAEKFSEEDKTVIQTGRAMLNEEGYVFDNNGNKRWLISSKIPLRDKDNNIIGLVGISRDNTERKLAQEALRESEEKYRLIFENSPLGLLSFDEKGVIIACNSRFADIIGTSIANLVGLDMLTLVDQKLVASVKKALEGKVGLYEDVYQSVSANKTVPVRALFTPIDTGGGNCCGGMGIIEDITERRQAEEALRLSEEKYRIIFENVQDVFYQTDLSGIVVEASPSIVHFAGYSRPEIIGKPVHKLYNNTNDRTSLLTELQKKGELRDYELILKTKTGNLKYVSINASLVAGADGQPHHIDGAIRDITERKLAEMALQESGEMYRNLVQKLPDGVYKSTPEGKFVDVNPAMVTMLGFASKEELMAIEIKTQLYFEPSDRESLVLQEQLEEMAVYRLKKKDGSELWVEDHGWYNSDKNGNITFHEGIMRDITTRRQADKTLRESEERHRTILQTAMDGFWMTDLEGHLLDVNETYCRMSGYSAQELLTMNISDVRVSDEGIDIISSNEKIKEQGEHSFETKNRRKDGSIYDVEVNVKYLPVDGGRLVTFLHDITERKKAEIALKKSEKLFQTMAEASPVGIFKTTNDGYTTYVNPKWSLLSGLSFEEALGNGWLKAVHLEDKELIGEGWQIATKNLKSSYSEYRFVRPDGSIVWVIGQAIPELNTENEIVGYIGTITDNTDRKMANEALKVSEEKLRTVFNTMEEGLALNEFLINDSGELVDYRILEVNPAYERILGLNTEQVTGKLATEAYQISQENIKELLKTFHDDDRPPITEEFDEKLDRWKLVSNSHPIGNKFVTSFFDITDRKKIEIELLFAKEKAEESDKLKSAFLANMSHEIRTPMNGILGFAELLKTPNLTGAEQMEYIQIIKKSGDRMLNIINDIVDISKIEAGQVKIFITETKVNEQTEFLYSFFKPEVESKGVQFILRNGLPGNEAIINTDKEKVYAVLTNLIKNAIKFTGKGSIEIGYIKKVATLLLEFYVKDTGFGIPKDRQLAIFDRFVQADIADTRAFQGAGLGLSISKAYVEMLGGNMWVESKEGKGSTFYFTIPYNPESEQNTSTQNTMTNEGSNQNRKLKILIVEDDETSEMLVSIAVKSLSNEILKAATGLGAIAACRANPDIDLILMDIKMPEMDGYEATRQIRQFNKDVCIIAQTAFGLVDEKEKAIASGCNDYVSKPLDIALLKEMIQKHFNPNT